MKPSIISLKLTFVFEVHACLVPHPSLTSPLVRYLRKCDELFTLKAAFNRLQEAKAYIAKETLSALMQVGDIVIVNVMANSTPRLS